MRLIKCMSKKNWLPYAMQECRKVKTKRVHADLYTQYIFNNFKKPFTSDIYTIK